MSKASFEASVERRIREGRLKLTRARHYGPDPAVIITNRVVDIAAVDLLMTHDRVRCDKCGALCALSPRTLKQAPEADIICVHCVGDSIPEGMEIRTHPDAILDMLRHRSGK